MLGKLICVLLLSAGMLIYDIPRLKKSSSHDRIVYGIMMLPLLYLAFVFIAAKSWPNLDSIFNLLSKPAEQIVHWLNPQQS
ncbi:hypothetical protein [Paenibacillus paeoniae]|uniref:Uncharacterized protein n=1 Tax=Paenibacillus paeoniae TaxID=2292705 RepID=A0A371PKY3_9BACL|nr:hypothetical protein [Paenibacillus paeoniae]REK76427.1 hypothetical protein DX130_05140 [Paenibacillus paeoniae]